MAEPQRVLVTGAAGFVGRVLCRRLLADGFSVIAVVRQRADFPAFAGASFVQAEVGDLADFDCWPQLLHGVDLVFHLAARAHVMHEDARHALDLYRAANVTPTARLAQAAVAAGVRRLTYVSSIKVNGERSDARPFRPEDVPAPQDAYGVSKREAEDVLRCITAGTMTDHVIVRSPLVYGPGVRANFLRLLRWVERGVPLPFSAVDNRRSLIYLENLADAIALGAMHPAAGNQTFLVADGQDVSTSALIDAIAQAMGKPRRQWPCPALLLRAAAGIAAKSLEADRLLGSLQADTAKMRSLLGWTPPYTLQQGLAETVRWYNNEKIV